MKRNNRIGFALLVLVAACGKDKEQNGGADAEKKAHETAIADLKQPVAMISAYAPYAMYPDDKSDKYAPKRRPDLEKSTLCAANEIRYAANKARQQLEVSSASATKDLQTAFKNVTTSCAEAGDPEAMAKCVASVKALDASLEKTDAAATAMGVTAKYPRIAPASVTDEAKSSMTSFLRARGPSAADTAFAQKRTDTNASVADVVNACQTASKDADDAAKTFEKADEPIRLIAVTRKMSMDSQCHALDALDSLHKDLVACKKKTKSTECKIVCGKSKNAVDEGVPAAAFTPMEKDYAEICEKP